ncbi:MAG: TonB-dependent receptor, partial [Candidatus Latescibacterota bacterium]
MLPSETRPVHTSHGLLPEDTVFRRGETLGKRSGIFASFDGVFGSRTAGDFDLGASYDADDRAVTMRIVSRSQKENTPANLAPSVRGFDSRGSFDTRYGNISLNLGILRESENALSDRFRGRDRAMERYSSGLRMKTSPFTGWELRTGGAISGGKYRDPEYPFNRSELSVNGDAAMTGDLEEITVTASAAAEHNKLGAESGSMFSLGATGAWLPLDNLGIRGGVRFSASAMPGYGTKLRIYPDAALDWTISPDMYLRVSMNPRIISHSFFDLYRRNGLTTPDAPILYEDRQFEISTEYGVLLDPGILFTTGVFGWRSEHAPVFSRKGGLFEIVPDSRLTVTGIRLGTRYDKGSNWSADGLLTLQNATWNQPGKVPYLPKLEFTAAGKYTPSDPWALYGTLRVKGKHFVEQGSDAAAKAFMTVDIGVEREVLPRYLDAFAEVRNLLNSSGAWWTE